MLTTHPSFLLLSRVWDLAGGGGKGRKELPGRVFPPPALRLAHPAAGLSSLCSCSAAPGGQAGLRSESTGAAVLPAIRWWLCGRPGKQPWCQSGEPAPGAQDWLGEPRVALPGEALDPHVRLTVWGGGDMGWGAPHLLGTGGWGSSHCGRLQVV